MPNPRDDESEFSAMLLREDHIRAPNASVDMVVIAIAKGGNHPRVAGLSSRPGHCDMMAIER
jgi:hypothetical protein